MVTLTPPVSTPTPVEQHRSYTFIWYQEIPSVGGVQRNQNFSPLAPGLKVYLRDSSSGSQTHVHMFFGLASIILDIRNLNFVFVHNLHIPGYRI